MAKTESTAVNDLIKIATTQTPLRADPSEDLMFAVPSKKDRNTKQHAMVPRGSDVPPLPRDRAPQSTQQNAIAMPAIAAPSALPRTTTSSPAIAMPPAIPRTTAPVAIAAVTAPEFLTDAVEPPIAKRASSPSLASIEPIATRATRPSLPPPHAPLPRTPLPSEYPVVSAVHSQPLAPAPQPMLDDAEPLWADDSLDVDVEPFHADSTAQLAKPRTTLEWMIKLAPLAGAMILLGVFVGGYLVFDGQGGKPRSAAAAPGTVDVKVVDEEPTPVAASAPALATAVAPATIAIAAAAAPAAATLPTAAPATPSITTPAATAAALARRPVLVDIRIDSTPSGATVTLVDRGKQTFIGTTPISAAVDPSRSYDIVLSHPRRPTQSVHLDPKATNRLAVVLGTTGTPSMPELAKPAAKSVAVTAPVANVAPRVASAKAPIAKPGKIVEPAWETAIEKAVKAEPGKPTTTEPANAEIAPKAEKAVGGNGTLMISSKPPCEIHVDGKPTGLMTPQRALTLPAGKHRITLVNPAQKIKKSVAVEITANESTKVIQDLTELMK